MPTITREAEAALFEISRQKSVRIEYLEKVVAEMQRAAYLAINDGISHGAVRWREALEQISRMPINPRP